VRRLGITPPAAAKNGEKRAENGEKAETRYCLLAIYRARRPPRLEVAALAARARPWCRSSAD